VLSINGFGRFEAVTTRYIDGELGLRFVCREWKRQRLMTSITNFVVSGATGPQEIRRSKRKASVSFGYIRRANGEEIACDVIDFSAQGMALRTQTRPPIGEVIHLGKVYGQVVRHHPEGIALHFVQKAEHNTDGE